MTTETPTTGPRAAGSAVADFTLTATDGKTYSSKAARQNGLLLTVLFKTGCGTCKYANPYLQRFHEQYAAPSRGRFQVWGISQDTPESTESFARENGNSTFPLLLDSDLNVTVDYGITNVPDLYLLSAEDTIPDAVVGHFSKDGFNQLAERVAAFLDVPYTPIVTEADGAPAIKPG
jgi:peroxiredoxin